MIDWITARVPCRHCRPIHGGQVIEVRPDGSIKYEVDKRLSVRGSFDSSLTIRSVNLEDEPDNSWLEISGNPVKFFQGHNLWGTSDLTGLVFELMRWLTLWDQQTDALLLNPYDSDVAAWRSGWYVLTRVDINESFRVTGGRASDAAAFIRAMHGSAHLSHRGRGSLVGDTTLLFKTKRDGALKLYSKAHEIAARSAHQPALATMPHAVEWAQGIIRAERVLRTRELKKFRLSIGTAWTELDHLGLHEPETLLRRQLGSLTMTTAMKLDTSHMKPRHAMAIASWENGADLSTMLTRPTFYRLRNELLPFGVDIATTRQVSNVVPLIRVLELEPAAPPAWAHGTQAFFEPRSLRAA